MTARGDHHAQARRALSDPAPSTIVISRVWKPSFCCAAIRISAFCRSATPLPGGYLLKFRNRAGDRVVHAPDFFREHGIDENIGLELSVVLVRGTRRIGRGRRF